MLISYQINSVCIDVAMFDLAHDQDTSSQLLSTGYIQCLVLVIRVQEAVPK